MYGENYAEHQAQDTYRSMRSGIDVSGSIDFYGTEANNRSLVGQSLAFDENDIEMTDTMIDGLYNEMKAVKNERKKAAINNYTTG